MLCAWSLSDIDNSWVRIRGLYSASGPLYVQSYLLSCYVGESFSLSASLEFLGFLMDTISIEVRLPNMKLQLLKHASPYFLGFQELPRGNS